MGVRNGSTGPGLRGRYGYRLRYRRGHAAAGRRNMSFSSPVADAAAALGAAVLLNPLRRRMPGLARRRSGPTTRIASGGTPAGISAGVRNPDSAPPSGSAGVPAARLLPAGAVPSGLDRSRENPGNEGLGRVAGRRGVGLRRLLGLPVPPKGTGLSDALLSVRVRKHLAGEQAARREQAAERQQGAGKLMTRRYVPFPRAGGYRQQRGRARLRHLALNCLRPASKWPSPIRWPARPCDR